MNRDYDATMIIFVATNTGVTCGDRYLFYNIGIFIFIIILMQSRYAAQPGTQMSAEMAWGGQRAQNKCSIRMWYWIRPGQPELSVYQIPNIDNMQMG